MAARNMTQSELARAAQVTQGTIQQLLSGQTKRTRHAVPIARALEVSVEWLDGHDVPDGTVRRSPELDYVQLTEVDVGYGMGGGTFIEEYGTRTPRVFDPRWLEEITRSPPEQLFVARGIGDSMMPTLLDNDTLIVDRAQRRITQQDRIWALTYGELGMIKRVRREPSGDFLLMSDNASISPIRAVADEFHVVGRIVWVGRKT